METATATAPINLDLNKSADTIRLFLQKEGVSSSVVAEMILVMDVSGSFEHEHKEGTTSTLVKRFVPFAIAFDPDQQIDVMTYSHGPENVQYVGTVDPTNCDNYVLENIVDRVVGWNGGTTYSYAIEEALKRFGWLACDHDHSHSGHGQRKPRFWDRIFGTPQEVEAPQHMHQKKRSIVIFVTDGENDPDDSFRDKERTRRVLQESQDRGDDVYFLFLGACEHADFEFVREIADRFKNTGIVMATDPEAFVELSDEALNAQIFGPELIEWLKK